MKMRLSDIQKKFPELLIEHIGAIDNEVDAVTPPGDANSTSLVFITDVKYLEAAVHGPAAGVVVAMNAKKALEGLKPRANSCIFFSKNVKLAMAKIKKEYFAPEIPLQKIGTIHPTALIEPSAHIGKNVSIGAYSVIGQNVVIGDDVRIDAAVIVEADVKIGRGSHLFSHLYIGPRTEIGERCEIMPNTTVGAEGFGFAHDERGHFHRIPQTGKVVLENDVEIGANCTIDRATFGVTRIGEGTKVDKLSHIAHNCDIGKHCVLAGKFAVAGSTKIGNHFVSGGRVTVKDGITITDRVEVAGLSGVQTSITEPGQYGGFPIQPVRDALRSGMSLAHLPEMRKNIAKIMKHLSLNSEDEAAH